MVARPRVAVVGPGGVGCYFGGMLARAGAAVTLIGRAGRASSAHLTALAREGLRLHKADLDERVAVAVATDPAAVGGADLVLFCVKTVDTDSAAAGIAPHVGARQILVDMQNGVDNPERLRRAGLDPVVAAVYVAAAVERPGEVRHRGRGDLVIGHPARGADVERAAGWFRAAGIGCVVSADVERELWLKLIVNSMANAVSALCGATYGSLVAFAPTWEVAREVAREAVCVARGVGQRFDEADTIERGLAICRAVGPATSSTAQDLAAGRPTEIDALNGYIARRGAELGIATPVNRALWALVRLAEQVPRG
jgi:2-dehydropantoate 2-reductase